jgi:Fe(3+) dicitrate transport protein
MALGLDPPALLRDPLAAFLDPSERVFVPFVITSIGLVLAIVGVRLGLSRLVDGLFARRLWLHRSTRVDAGVLALRAVLGGAIAIPWAGATAAASLAIGLSCHDTFGPAPELAIPPPVVGLLYTMVLFVAWDASRFGLHLFLHRVPLLWCFHQVHHSAAVLTPLTLYRVHPVESLLYDLRGVVTTALITGPFLWLFRGTATELQLLGVNAIGFLLNAAGGPLRHSHVWLAFGRLERWILSPAQHQIHHAREPELAGRNFGTWLAVWDRWLGTWRAAPSRPIGTVGVSAPDHDPDRVLSLVLAPFLAAARLTRRSRAVLPLLLVLPGVALLRPGRSHAAPPETPSGEAPVDFELESTDPPAAPSDARAAPPAPGGAPEGSQDVDWALEKVSIIGADAGEGRVVGSAHAIGEEELERRENDDVHRVLADVPGVYVREEDGFGLRPNIGLRGASSDRSAKVTLMEDGVLLAPAPYAAPAAYYFPIMTRMAGVEVFKGPAALRHGPNTIGGALNLQTRAIPREMRGFADLGVGMRGYGKLHGWWGTSLPRLGVLLEGVRLQSDGFKHIDGGGETGFGKNELMTKVRWNVDPGQRWYHQIDAKGGVATETSHETYLGLSDADFAAAPYRRYAASRLDVMRWWRTQAQLGWFVARGSVFDLSAQAYRHDLRRRWRKLARFRGADLVDVLRTPDAGQTAVYHAVLTGQADSFDPDQTLIVGTNDRLYASEGVATVAHWRPTTRRVRQDIELGARLHHDRIRRLHTEDGYAMRTGALVPEGTPTETTAHNTGIALAGAFHLVDQIGIGRLTLVPGARVELIQTWLADRLGDDAAAFDAVFLPGGGVHVAATPWLGFLAGVHSGFSPVAPGQPDEVRPERSVNYEAGARIDHSARRGRTRVEAIGFLNDYSNISSECTFSSGCDDAMINRQFNGGQVLVWGVEALAGERVSLRRTGWLEARGTYTYTGSYFLREFSSDSPILGDVAVGDALPYVPVHLAGAGLSGGGRIWGVDADASFVGDMRDRPGQGPIPGEERIPWHLVVDVGGRVQIGDHVTVYATAQNLADTAYMVSRRPFGARPGRPFQFMIGLKYAFF